MNIYRKRNGKEKESEEHRLNKIFNVSPDSTLKIYYATIKTFTDSDSSPFFPFRFFFPSLSLQIEIVGKEKRRKTARNFKETESECAWSYEEETEV